MTAKELMESARVPLSLKPQGFGPWFIERVEARNKAQLFAIGWSSYTLLWHTSWARMHLDERGEIVMEAAGEHVIFALFTFGDGEPASTGRYIFNGEQAAVSRSITTCLNEMKSREGLH